MTFEIIKKTGPVLKTALLITLVLGLFVGVKVLQILQYEEKYELKISEATRNSQEFYSEAIRQNFKLALTRYNDVLQVRRENAVAVSVANSPIPFEFFPVDYLFNRKVTISTDLFSNYKWYFNTDGLRYLFYDPRLANYAFQKSHQGLTLYAKEQIPDQDIPTLLTGYCEEGKHLRVHTDQLSLQEFYSPITALGEDVRIEGLSIPATHSLIFIPTDQSTIKLEFTYISSDKSDANQLDRVVYNLEEQFRFYFYDANNQLQEKISIKPTFEDYYFQDGQVHVEVTLQPGNYEVGQLQQLRIESNYLPKWEISTIGINTNKFFTDNAEINEKFIGEYQFDTGCIQLVRDLPVDIEIVHTQVSAYSTQFDLPASVIDKTNLEGNLNFKLESDDLAAEREEYLQWLLFGAKQRTQVGVSSIGYINLEVEEAKND